MTASAPHRSSDETASRPGNHSARADGFLRLFHGPAPLVLPSAWDPGTARLVEQAGAAAVALSAAGVAWSLGSSAVQPLRDEELLAVCERVCRSIAVPVTVDLRGAADRAHDLPELVEALAARGIAGLTLPHSPRLDDDRRRLGAVRAAAHRANVRLHVAAHVAAEGAPRSPRSAREAHWGETVRRARACADAGADSVLVTGLDWGEVVSLVRELPVPVGVDVGDGWAPPVHAFARAGVRLVALGLGPLRTAMGALRTVAVEAIDRGSYDLLNRALASIDGTCGPA